MKYLIIAFLGHFVTLGFAQSNELNQVDKLINSFKTEKNIESLEKAEGLITEIFSKKDFRPNAAALYSKAKVMSLLLQNTELDNVLDYSKQLQGVFSEALAKDEDMSLRYDILSDIYLSKIKMMNLGNEVYEDKKYAEAYDHYQNVLSMNELEVAYPRYAKRDTSLIFTSSVFASLAKKNKEAIAGFEELEKMKYNRKDLYDYLARLYTEEGMEEKAKRAMMEKERLYPE